MAKIKKEFSQLLYERRILKKMSREQLGRILNIRPQNIYLWENGREPKMNLFIRVCRYFDIKLSEIKD
ncbi:MAG: helix-turn-helix transcriptional regulator [Desulfobacteraceae bacterium]|nr:helix-turn-helix transcriptional regulator [Desulfobacteraceae bacterium]